jgi:Protein of unknown function (DUF3144)
VTSIPDDVFAQLIADHIELANKQGETADPGFVGAALMHAAARYNAYVSSGLFQTGGQMVEAREAHLDHYAKQYREFLEYHYDLYAANFARFTAPAAKP